MKKKVSSHLILSVIKVVSQSPAFAGAVLATFNEKKEENLFSLGQIEK